MMTSDHHETDHQGAPGELELLRKFVNTRDLDNGEEELESPAHLNFWLVQHNLLVDGTVIDEAGWKRALEIREALRALLLGNSGIAVDTEAVATLNRAAERGRLQVNFDNEGQAELMPSATGVDGAVGRLLAIAYTAMSDGSWARLKACRNSECHWAFFDHSKNRSGTWCSMAVCGSRMKARAYRERKAKKGKKSNE